MTIRFPGTFADQYPYELTAALRRYRVYDPDYGLYKDPEIYEKLAKDAAIFDADDTHNNMVAGSDWFFDSASDRPQDKQAAQFMEVIFKRIQNFTQVRKNLAGARLMGSVWGVVDHEKVRVRFPWENRHREIRAISGVTHKDKRNFRLLEDRAPETKTGWKWEVHQGLREGIRSNATIGNWVDVDSRYVRHSYADVEKSLGYGRGVVEAVYTLWWIKAAALEHGLDWLERWARGEIVVNTDLSIEAEKNVTSSTRMANLIAVIQKIRKGGGLVLPKGDEAKILEPSGTGYEAALKMVAYCDSEIRRLLLGADLPGGTSPGGAFASDVVKENSIELKVMFGRALLEETIDRTMAARVWNWNTITRYDLGLSKAERPAFRLRREKRESPKDRLEILKGGAELGILARKDEAASQLGITLASEGEETITAPATTTQGQGIPAQFMPQPGEQPREAVGQADEQGTVAAPNNHTITLRHVYAAEFDESKHPRGQPGNAGQFGPGGADGKTGEPKAESAEPSKGVTSQPAEKSAEPAKEKKAPPGSQLADHQRTRLKELGIKKLPAAEIDPAKVEVRLEGDDIHRRAVLRWKDKSGKVQSAYTPEFHAAHAAKKWAKIEKLLPHVDKMRLQLVAKVKDAKLGTPESAAATAAAMIAVTGLRPGNPESVKHEHFGMATLNEDHVTIDEAGAHFDFIGKSGKQNKGTITEPAIVASLKALKERATKGGKLFPVSLAQVRAAAPEGIRLKDFRTALATQTAMRGMTETTPPPPLSKNNSHAKKQLAAVLKFVSSKVAATINNTPAVARSAYIHPRVFREWAEKIGGSRALELAGIA